MIHFHKYKRVRESLEVFYYEECEKCGKRRITVYDGKKRKKFNRFDRDWVKRS